MTSFRQLFRKTIKVMQKTLAAVAALAMVTAVTPTTAWAGKYNTKIHGNHGSYKKNHGHYRGHKRHYRGHKRHYRGHKRHHRGHNRYYGGHRGHYRGYKRHHRRGNGSAIAAGIIGLTAGAIIASEVNRSHHRSNRHYNTRRTSYEPYTPAWYRACARKYRSFNANTGKYLAYSGKYRFCRI